MNIGRKGGEIQYKGCKGRNNRQEIGFIAAVTSNYALYMYILNAHYVT